MPSLRFGIFGGTFNPVHYGHLRLAYHTHHTLGLDKTYFIPAFLPPHKAAPGVKHEHRLKMLKLALNEEPWAAIDSQELERKGKSYTINTIRQYKVQYPDAILYLIIGEDSFNNFNSWYKFEQILEVVNLVVMPRESLRTNGRLSSRMINNLEQFKSSANGKAFVLQHEYINISSRQIRESFKENILPKFLVPDSVLEYINRMGIYDELKS